MGAPASHSKGDVHPPTGPPLTKFWSEACILLLGVLLGRTHMLKVSTGRAWGTGWGDALSPHPRGWWAQQVAAELSSVLKCLAKTLAEAGPVTSSGSGTVLWGPIWATLPGIPGGSVCSVPSRPIYCLGA